MDVIVYNPQKGRLETIKAHFTEETTTWFDGMGHPECVRMITDLNGNLLITRDGRDYPVISARTETEKETNKEQDAHRFQCEDFCGDQMA